MTMKYQSLRILGKNKTYSRLMNIVLCCNTKLLTTRILCILISTVVIALLSSILMINVNFLLHKSNFHFMLRGYDDENQLICEYLFQKSLSWIEYISVRNIQLTNGDGVVNFTDPRSCHQFKLFQRQAVHVSSEEEHFPLAFSLTVHENIRPVSRLLRLIYRPHNLYCIHVDSKSPQAFYNGVLQLAKCFGSNVMVVNRSESVNVQWGHYSLLEAFLLCAEKLIRNRQVIWKYILNVSGQELPLRTNWELVAALKAMNGSNVVENLGSKYNPERWPKRNFSFPIYWSKGSFYVALSRDFVNFYQTDPKAGEILDAMKSEKHLMKHPDELFFSTLVSNPSLGAPGACDKIYLTSNSDARAMYIGRYVTWAYEGCRRGKSRHGVCLIGTYYLPFIPSRMEFFANKFSEDFQPIAYDCTEYYIMKKVLREMRSNQLDASFNVTFYSQLYCSQYHVN
ncbi:unnamed protein product [Heterobilharzia americana]|nr:unnamed protein product [Heterobilharzia americana]